MKLTKNDWCLLKIHIQYGYHQRKGTCKRPCFSVQDSIIYCGINDVILLDRDRLAKSITEKNIHR